MIFRCPFSGCAVLKARGEARSRQVSGGYGEGETPLPIPNRAVKPLSADGTWLARARESRTPPVLRYEPPEGGSKASNEETGGDLLSRSHKGQVPSALWGLTSLFGMGRGVSPTPEPPNLRDRNARRRRTRRARTDESPGGP